MFLFQRDIHVKLHSSIQCISYKKYLERSILHGFEHKMAQGELANIFFLKLIEIPIWIFSRAYRYLILVSVNSFLGSALIIYRFIFHKTNTIDTTH